MSAHQPTLFEIDEIVSKHRDEQSRELTEKFQRLEAKLKQIDRRLLATQLIMQNRESEGGE